MFFWKKKPEHSHKSAPLPVGSRIKGEITRDLVVLTSKKVTSLSIGAWLTGGSCKKGKGGN